MPKKKRPRSTFTYEGTRYETTGKTQKEADQKAAVKLEKLKRGEVGITGSMTVKQWANEWLETYKRPSVGVGQYKNYKIFIDGVIIPAIGLFRVRDIKDVHLQKILNSRAGKSKSDLTKLRATIKAIFSRARKSQLITVDPSEDLELPAAVDKKRRSITDAERKHILNVSDWHHGGLWVKTMLYCGLRPGETRALDWRHIDFKTKRLHVEQAMKAHTKEIGTTKTDAGERYIPIPDKLLPDLKAASIGRSPFDPVFTKPIAKGRHDKGSMDHMWQNFKRELDISMGAKVVRNQITLSVVAPDLVPYCLRHTYGTDLQDAGVPLNVAKYLMGHKDITVTANIYTDTTKTAIDAAAKKINARDSGKRDKKQSSVE